MTRDAIAELLPPTTADTEGDGSDLARVTKLEVGLTKTRRAILVRLTPHASADVSGQSASAATYALSPPAAKRLSRLLNRAVKDYLKPPRRKQDNDQK